MTHRMSHFAWEDWSRDELLDLKLCDLKVRIDGTWLEALIGQIYRELEQRDLKLKPHFWLSDEWFSPDGMPGVALPFYLAHPRLMRLERQQMLQVEGGRRTECLKLMRHEVGHAIQHGFQLQRRRHWQRIFGKASEAYPEYYRPNPASKRFVEHLDGWYAQAHPCEDFAETFAVWLKPRSDWRERYADWPAAHKLNYVDELMGDIAGAKPKVRSRAKPYSLPRLRYTLRTYYQRKRERFTAGFSEMHDRDLLRLFSDDPKYRRRPTAASFLRENRREIRELVANWSGEYIFTLDQVLREMIGRCRELKLRLTKTDRETKLDFAILLTVHTIQYLHRGREWHPM
jgi:hypothetical protein